MYTVSVLENGKVTAGELQNLRGASTVWADFTNPTDEELENLQTFTKIPAAQIRAWMEGKKRPVAMDFQNYSVITFLTPFTQEKRGKKTVYTEPCVMLISNDRNDFITIHKTPFKAIEEMKGYSDKHTKEMFKSRATFILFTILNEIIEDYYESLDKVNAIVHEAEELALNISPEKNLMHRILHAKKSMIFFHKALISNREVITAIEHEHLSFLDDNLLREFRTLSSSITQLIEINSTYRDILNTTTEIHLTAISNSLNTTMKKITSWGAIILVPSLIAGIFGMNFRHFSAFDWTYGPEISFAAMAVSVIVLYFFFKKKDWI